MTENIEFTLFMSFGILIIILTIVLLVFKIKKYKRILKTLKPKRYLNKEDLKAIQFLDIDVNLSANLISRKLPKRKIQKGIWEFSNCTFSIKETYRAKRVVILFFLKVNNEIVEVYVPEVFLPYLKMGGTYSNKTIEVVFRTDHFILLSIEDLISYNTLYNKFQLERKALDSSLRRKPTEEELQAFSFSKWSSAWSILFTIFFPIITLGFTSNEMGVVFAFFPIIIIIPILFYKAYKKRKAYIESRMVYYLKGKLWFDKNEYVYRINEDELKLHRKWRKIIENEKLPIHNIEMEAMLHTFDNLESRVRKRFQPVEIKSDTLRIKESNLKSTRNWGVVFLYWMAFIAITSGIPTFSYNRDFILNPLDLFIVRENYFFSLLVTLIWWASIIATLYLTCLLVNRIKGYYFDD